MLKNILSYNDCAQCKYCCVFTANEMQYVPKFPTLLKERVCKDWGGAAAFVPCECEEDLWDIVLQPQADGLLRCPLCHPNKGCGLGADKPVECAAWPFSIALKNTKMVFCLEHSCPPVNRIKDKPQVQRFAVEQVAPPLHQWALRYPHILRNYDAQNKILLTYD